MTRSLQLRALKGLCPDLGRPSVCSARPKVDMRLEHSIQPFRLSDGDPRAVSDEALINASGSLARIRVGEPTPKAADLPQALAQAEDFFCRQEAARAAGGLGSSIARNSHTSHRNGFHGLTPYGRGRTSNQLALLEEQRPVLSFWTITLPPEALVQLNRLNGWPTFQKRVMQELCRKLERAGLPPVVTGVAEIQPRRSEQHGMPCPHLHAVFVGRSGRGAAWAIRPSELDEIIVRAARSAGVTGDIDWSAAGNVQQVKKSVRAYMAKYMTKGSGSVAQWVGSEFENLIPRQWWFRSQAMKQMGDAVTVDLPPAFAAWVYRYHRYLEEEGFLQTHWYNLPEGVPETMRVRYESTEALALLLARWQESEWQRLEEARRQAGVWTDFGELSYGHKPEGMWQHSITFERLPA